LKDIVFFLDILGFLGILFIFLFCFQYVGVVCQNLSITFLMNDISMVWSCELKVFLDTTTKTNR